VTPGEDNVLYLEIHNSGNQPLTNIRFSSKGPEGWLVLFMPESIEHLSAKSVQTVGVNIKPPDDAQGGEYRFNLFAETSETRRVISARVSVETTPSVWVWIGVAIAVVVVVGFIFLFLRSGRQ
jgi:uncharacterized membrane protein